VPFLALFGGGPTGAPEGPWRGPEPRGSSPGGWGGDRPTTPRPGSPRWAAEPWRLPRRATQGRYGPRRTCRTPASPGAGPRDQEEQRDDLGLAVPRAPVGDEGGSPSSGVVFSATVPRGPDITGSRSGPAPEPDRGPAAPLPWGGPGGTVPPGAAGMKPGVWGCPPYRVPTLWTMPGPRNGVPCPSAGPRPPIPGPGVPRPQTPFGAPEPMPGGTPRRGVPGAPPGPRPRGGKFPPPGAPPGKVPGAPETGPGRARGPGPPKWHFWGLYIARIGPVGGSGGVPPRTTFWDPPSGGCQKSGSFVGHLITLPVGTDQPTSVFGTAGTAGPRTAGTAGPEVGHLAHGRVIKPAIGVMEPPILGARGSGTPLWA